MKIIVKKRGWGTIKPPEGIEKLLPMENNEFRINPKWMEFHRQQPTIRAVTLLDTELEVGEYDAELTWQYYSDISGGWFPTRDPRGKIAKNNSPVRLVYLKKYPKKEKHINFSATNEKCKICKALLYKHEEEAGYCGYCVGSKEGTKIIKEFEARHAL